MPDRKRRRKRDTEETLGRVHGKDERKKDRWIERSVGRKRIDWQDERK